MDEEITLDRRCDRRAASPTLRELAGVVFRQRRLLVVSFAVVLILSVAYGLLTSTYRAEMKILVRRGRVDPPVAPQASGMSQLIRSEITEEEMNSEVELLRDHAILQKVVEANDLGAQEEGWWWKHSRQAQIERAVRRLAGRLHVDPVRKTKLIAVSFEDNDAARAARVLNSLAQVYMEKHLEVQRPSGEFRFFEQQTERYGKELDNSEAKLLGLIEQKNVISAALERDIALQKWSDADASQRQTRVAIAEAERRVQGLQSQLAELPERTTTVIKAADNPQLLGQLKSNLLTLELKKTELLTKFEPSYRLVQEVEQQISETKAAIANEEQSPVREETTDKNKGYEWAKSELEKAQVELGGLHARATAYSGVVAGYQQRAKMLGAEALAEQDLMRTAKTAEENYLLYVRKREEARIGDALDQRRILNVTMVSEATEPALPKRSPLMVAWVGLLLAGSVSTVLAFAADYLDPALRTPAEVMALLEAPVLASLPRRAA